MFVWKVTVVVVIVIVVVVIVVTRFGVVVAPEVSSTQQGSDD